MNRFMFSARNYDKLVANHREQLPLKGTRGERDFCPVCHLTIIGSAAQWLLTELDPEEEVAFGLCDLGLGFPEIGSVWMPELAGLGLPVVEDLAFHADRTLRGYARLADQHQRIIC